MFRSFLDFNRAFDRVWQEDLWQVRRSFKVEGGLVQAVLVLYENSSSEFLFTSQPGEFFKTTVGVSLGYILSPILFNLFLERIMQETLHGTTQPSPLTEGPNAIYDLPTASILWTAAMVNFTTSLTES